MTRGALTGRTLTTKDSTGRTLNMEDLTRRAKNDRFSVSLSNFSFSSKKFPKPKGNSQFWINIFRLINVFPRSRPSTSDHPSTSHHPLTSEHPFACRQIANSLVLAHSIAKALADGKQFNSMTKPQFEDVIALISTINAINVITPRVQFPSHYKNFSIFFQKNNKLKLRLIRRLIF